ncbi:hypothetical protein NQZ68_017316 [Dissostichus eleginoides]|nr:hypothetical protein NQZ68_017316 [Dissostichus eleginoides]
MSLSPASSCSLIGQNSSGPHLRITAHRSYYIRAVLKHTLILRGQESPLWPQGTSARLIPGI